MIVDQFVMAGLSFMDSVSCVDCVNLLFNLWIIDPSLLLLEPMLNND